MSSLCYSISNEHMYSFKNFTFQGIYNDLIRSGLSHTINLEMALPLSIHRCHYHLTLGLTQSHTTSLHVVRTNRIKDCLVVEWRSKKHPREWRTNTVNPPMTSLKFKNRAQETLVVDEAVVQYCTNPAV